MDPLKGVISENYPNSMNREKNKQNLPIARASERIVYQKHSVILLEKTVPQLLTERANKEEKFRTATLYSQ